MARNEGEGDKLIFWDQWGLGHRVPPTDAVSSIGMLWVDLLHTRGRLVFWRMAAVPRKTRHDMEDRTEEDEHKD